MGMPRYRASKRDVHLNVGWRWLVWDDVENEYVGDPNGYQSRELAEQAAETLNEETT